MDRRADSDSAAGGGVGGFVADVVLWRRGRGEVSGCVLAATVSGWLLFLGPGGYALLSLASHVLLLLLAILFLWAKAARLLGRPEPPIPEMRVPQEAVHEMAALLHSALNRALSAFHHMTLGGDSLLFCRVFLSLWILSLLATLAGDLPTFCYAGIVALLTIPALCHKYQECIRRYMRFAYMNLHMYEMLYERLATKCFLRARTWLIQLLKDP